MFGLVRSGRRCDGGTRSLVGLLQVRTARLSVSSLVAMWLTVVTAEHGRLCVDVSDEDPSAYAVRQILQRILQVDISQYDLMLGTYRLTGSMSLADFGLLDEHSDLSLVARVMSSKEAAQDEIVSLDDPIEEASPNMSETDPIDWTQTEKHGRRSLKRKPHNTPIRRKDSATGSAKRRLPFFPNWRSKDV